jgi:hypothetical protein
MRSVIATSAVLALLVTGTGAVASGSARLLWNGSFIYGVENWTNVQAADGGFAIVPAPAGRTGKAARFLIRPGDVPIGASGERAEVYKVTDEQPGTLSVWGWSVYFPRGASSSPNTSWNVFTQWHHNGSYGVQPLSFEITNKDGREWLRLRVWGGDPNSPMRRAWQLAPLERGRWYDLALRVRWAPDARGSVQVWLDRREVVRETLTATLYAGQGVYLKQGFYRAPSDVTSEVYIAGTRRGTSLADVGIVAGATTAKLPAKLPTPSPRPANEVRPAVVGVAKQGAILRSFPGSWSKGPTGFAYQWQWSSDLGVTWMNVKGATRSTFDVTSTFVGARVRVVVAAKNAAGFTTSVSVPVSPTA